MNRVRGIKFLGWYFLRCDKYNEKEPLHFPAGFTDEHRDDRTSVLGCDETLETGFNTQTTVHKDNLYVLQLDSRPSYVAEGATVFDEHGTMGIIDMIDGDDVVITTVMSRG